MASPTEARFTYQPFPIPDSPSPLSLPVEIRRYPRALDISDVVNRQGGNNYGVRYEEQNFEVLAESLPNNRAAVGPHLLDRAAIIAGYPVVNFARPDTLVFQQNGGTLQLIEMVEFKSRREKRSSEIKSKIAAFPDLLDYLRINPALLPGLLNQATDNHTDFRRIIVPPNFEISVLIVSAYNYTADFSDLPFDTRVEYSPLRI